VTMTETRMNRFPSAVTGGGTAARRPAQKINAAPGHQQPVPGSRGERDGGSGPSGACRLRGADSEQPDQRRAGNESPDVGHECDASARLRALPDDPEGADQLEYEP
jgi:hypothetical protein